MLTWPRILQSSSTILNGERRAARSSSGRITRMPAIPGRHRCRSEVNLVWEVLYGNVMARTPS